MDGIAGGELAAAVGRAGGLGMIGGGYGDATWLKREFARAEGAPVGCGFITWSLRRQPELLDIALSHRPVAVMLSFGDPSLFAGTVKASGAPLLCQIQDVEQARRALDAGADVLVAQGSEAGGHGFGARTTLTLVPEIVDLVAASGAHVPVLAAGGIGDGRGLAAALMLGASGVLAGTRFYAAAEALSTTEARQRLVSATGDGTCRTTVYDLVRGYDWPAGHTMSVLANEFTARWHGAEADLRDHLDDVAPEFRQAVAARDYDTANVTVGQAAGVISAVVSAADIVTSMAEQAESALGSQP